MFRSQDITFDAALRDLRDSAPAVRARAAAALGSSHEEDRAEAGAALLAALADERGEVRHAAALSLAELGTTAAAPLLIGLLEDPDVLVREAAAIALGRIGAAEAAWGPLSQALRDGAPPVRFQAAASLAELDAARAAPLLRAALADADPEVRGSAAAGLSAGLSAASAAASAAGLSAASATPETAATLAALAALLDDGHSEPRSEAALALARAGDRRATPVLLGLLDDRRRALDAAQALAPLRDERSEGPLRALLRRWLPHPLLKVRAAYALSLLGHEEGRAHLRKAAASRREEVSGLATELLAELPAT